MKRTLMKLLAATVVLAFLFPTAAFGVTGQATTRPNANQQSAAQLTPEQRQARRQERLAARKARVKEQREKQIARQITRLEKVKAAMEKNGKTSDPKYQKVVDHIAKLQARLDKLSAQVTQ
jgi:ubiquinone biosynthesis protein UbiJ